MAKNTFGEDISQAPGSIVPTAPAGTPAPAPVAPAPAPVAAPATTTPTTDSTPSPYYSRYTPEEQSAADYLNKPVQERSVDDIQAEKTKAAQAQIDSLNHYYDSLASEQRDINSGRDRQTSSVSTLTGLAGSTEANVAANKTTALNQRDLEKIGAEREAAIQDIFSKIRSSAADEARQSRLDARQSANDILANRTQRQTEATTHLTNLAKSGVTADGLKASDPQSYDYLVRNVGSESDLKALFTLNRPVESIVDKRIEGGKYIIAYQNPLDGKTRIESIDLGIPNGYSKTIDAGDRILAVPDNWDGDPSKLITINKGLTPGQAAKGQGTGGTTVDEDGNVIQTGNYDALTIGRYNKAANAATAILQKNPTFKNIIGSSAYLDRIEAAIQHPGSVGDQELLDAFTQLNTGGNRVTEAQVHLITQSQSLADTMSKYANKLSTGGALSNDQRQQIIALARDVYSNYQRSYQPLYEDATNRLQAQGIPKQFWNIPDPKTLSRSVADGSGTESRSNVLTKDGQSFDASELTPEEYQQAIKDGYTAK